MKKTLCHLTDLTTPFVFYGIFAATIIYFGKYPMVINAPLQALKDLSFPYPSWLQYSFLAALGVAAFVPILNPFREKNGDYGAAHYANKKEIKKMDLMDPSGIILGVHQGNYIRTSQPLSVLVYAPPGSGKTAGIIIPSLISCSHSAVVHDPKGELYFKTKKRRSEFSKIIKFAPGEKDSFKWNPLSKKELPEDWADKEVHIGRISETVIPDNPKNPGDHWPTAARDFFMFWALYLVWRDGETSIPTILKEPLQTPDIQVAIAEILDGAENLPERVRLSGNGLIGKPENEFGSIVSTFQTNLAVFFDERISKNMSDSDFCTKDLREECTTIYLWIKNSDQTRLKNVVTLFFETVTLTMLDHEPYPGEQRVTAYLDEFVRMARIKELLEMPAIGRSYGFNAIYVCQSTSQVIGIYGQEGMDQLKNTCTYHVFFAQNEQKVAEDISKSIGNHTRTKISHSSSGKGFTKNKSMSKEGVPLILPQQIMSLKKGRVLICMQNNFETPVDAKCAFWFKDSAMKPHIQDVDDEDIAGPNDTTKNEVVENIQPELIADPEPENIDPAEPDWA